MELNQFGECLLQLRPEYFQFAVSENKDWNVQNCVMWSVVLYGCETWPDRLKEEHGLSVFENRVLRKIPEPELKEVRGVVDTG